MSFVIQSSSRLSRIVIVALLAASGIVSAQIAAAQYGQGQGQYNPGQYDQGQQQGGYQSFGPTQGMNMNATQANPFVGSWFGKSPLQDGSGFIVSFAEYLPNGNSRATTIIQGGPLNGTRMQMWGKYSVKQVGQSRYQLTFYLKGVAPSQFCVQGGGCQNNNLPASSTEMDDVEGPNNFHSHSEMNGTVTDMEVSRAAVPPQLMTTVGPTLTMAAPPQSAGGGNGGGQSPTMPTLHPYTTPGGGTYHVPGQGGTCDDAQQNRVCTVNSGHMYTDSRGCRMCAGPN